MDIKEIIEAAMSTFSGLNQSSYMMDSNVFKMPGIKEKLLQCKEFENVNDIIFLEHPIGRDLLINGVKKDYQALSIMLKDNMRFKNVLYLHSITLTPETYLPEDLLSPVEDGIMVSPSIISHDFNTQKSITLFYNPEELQDEVTKNGKDADEILREQFDKALKTPEKYTPKGTRAIMLRGIFDVIPLAEGEPSGENVTVKL